MAGRGKLSAVVKPIRKRQRYKRVRRRKYVPGTLGVSAVSEAIKQDYGAILDRRTRRKLAREGVAFKRYNSK